MLYNMKKLSLKKASVRLILLIIAGVMGILLFYGKMRDYLEGPQDLTSDSFSYGAGEYVEFDLKDVMVMDCFLERNDRDAKGNITNYYYYIVGVADKNKKNIECIVVMADADEKDVYDKFNKYFKNRVNGKKGGSLDNFVDSGKLMPMSKMMDNKMKEYIQGYYGNNYSTKVHCQPYYIIPYKPGAVDMSVFIISSVLILSAFAEIILIAAGFKQRKIRRYIVRNCAGGIKACEYDYEYSRFFNKSIRIGDLYTYILQREGICLIDNKKILWAYECVATGKNNRGSKPDAGYSGIEVWDNEFRCYELFINDVKITDSILDYMAVHFPYVVVGYNNMLSGMFFNNNQDFKNLAYNKCLVENGQDGGDICLISQS